MTIDIDPDTVGRLKANAQAVGVSIAVYVEQLISEAESRRLQMAAFRQAVDERLASLNTGESVNGEDVMAQLIAEIDEPDTRSGTR
jgi:predicted transcriptional regulator